MRVIVANYAAVNEDRDSVTYVSVIDMTNKCLFLVTNSLSRDKSTVTNIQTVSILDSDNKAGCMAANVACGWAGAVIIKGD